MQRLRNSTHSRLSFSFSLLLPTHSFCFFFLCTFFFTLISYCIKHVCQMRPHGKEGCFLYKLEEGEGQGIACLVFACGTLETPVLIGDSIKTRGEEQERKSSIRLCEQLSHTCTCIQTAQIPWMSSRWEEKGFIPRNRVFRNDMRVDGLAVDFALASFRRSCEVFFYSFTFFIMHSVSISQV